MFTKTTSCCIALITLCAPFAVAADVVINEFLYDAQGTDADQEYIELYNAGDTTVDLTKYRINDGSNHALNVPPKNGGTGSISIPAGGYVLLVDNATDFLAAHPGISGTVIDTVLSLSNTGATLTLLDDGGAPASSVIYTKDQGAAGDGNSLQKSGASWTVAVPTPNAANAAETAPTTTVTQADTQTASSTTTTASPSQSGTPVSSYVPPPEPTLFVDAGGNRTVIVGADTVFRGRAYNKKREDVERVRFLWNFGDGSTAEGPSVLHHYDYPGRYAAILTIAEDRTALSAQVIVTAEPARLSFTTSGDGSVGIGNLAGRDLDLSGWIVRSFGRMFILPEHSVILAGSSMRISQKTLDFFSGPETVLDYPNGALALSANVAPQETAPAPLDDVPRTPIVTEKRPLPVAHTAPSQRGPEQAEEGALDATERVSETASMQLAAAAQAGGGSAYWWLGALAFAGALGVGAVAARRLKKGEWDIVEETK